MTGDELSECHKKGIQTASQRKTIFKEHLKTSNKQFRQCHGGAFQ